VIDRTFKAAAKNPHTLIPQPDAHKKYGREKSYPPPSICDECGCARIKKTHRQCDNQSLPIWDDAVTTYCIFCALFSPSILEKSEKKIGIFSENG
jgi:hypothetical protein